MDYYSIIRDEKEEEMTLENLVLKIEKIDKYDAKKIGKIMIGVMAKLKYDNRLAIKYVSNGLGIKTIVYIKDKNNK